MKKRIGNDISFVWHIFRKSGEAQVPESFTGKEVEVRLISPLQRPVTIENVSIATGVVTFTFRGKHQVTLGNYVAVLLENRGENGMVTLDVVSAVTLVAHSYMEEDGDDGDVIEAEAVELESEIGQGIDAYTKAETDALLEGKYDKVDNVYIYDDGISVGKENGVGSTLIGGNKLAFFEDALGNKQGSIFLYDDYLRLQDKARGYHVSGKKIATEVELAGKQDTIDDLDAIRSGAQAGATAYQKPVTGIPATDLASDVQSDLAAIDGISEVIPAQASSDNKLADKNFVNSSIATNTANYISDNGQPFQSVEDLEAYSGVLTNNDYAFVVGVDSVGNTTYSRYKYNASTQQWALEYVLNNSSFTAEQWAAINSSITSGLVTKLSALPTNSELATLLNGKANTSDLAEVATTGSYNDLSDQPTLDDLNKDSELYALDNSNADYIAAVNALITQGTEIPISHDIEGAKLRVYKKTYGGTETGSTSITLIEPPVSEIPYSDGTTFVAYQRGSARYIGLKWNFFDNTDESYTNGNIEVTCEVAGVLKLYFLNCNMLEDAYFKKNGQTTKVKLKNGVLSFDVEAGDVLTVSPTYSNGYQGVGLVGMSITGKYPVSKFINDAGYVAKSVDNLVNYYLKSETYTKTEVQQLIGAIQQFHYEVYPTLPQTGASNVLYLIGPTGTGTDKYEEYVYANNDWTKIGDTSIDLSGYVTTEALTTALADYVTSSALSTALAGKADKSEMSVVQGTGADADKTTITLKQGTSATVLTTHQDISGKEDITPIEAVASGTTAITAQVNKYYEVAGTVSSLTVTLPTPTANTEVTMVVVHFTAAANNPVVFVTSSATVAYSVAYSVVANKEYELSCLYNGSKWIVSSMEVAV